MDWDKCTQMVQLHNSQNDSFYEFVTENLSEIKGQSLEMLLDCISLTEIGDRPAFFEKLVAHVSTPGIAENMSLRATIRVEGLKELWRAHNEETMQTSSDLGLHLGGDSGRGLVCVFCGEGFGYSGQTPDEATLKAAVDHEKGCPNNPYKSEIEKLRQEVVRGRHEGFATGVVYALARLVEMHDQPSMAGDILRESGVDVCMAAEYDVAFLRKANNKLPKGRE